MKNKYVIVISFDAVSEEDLEFLAESAMADACTPGNPKDPTLEDIINIYKSIM